MSSSLVSSINQAASCTCLRLPSPEKHAQTLGLKIHKNSFLIWATPQFPPLGRQGGEGVLAGERACGGQACRTGLHHSGSSFWLKRGICQCIDHSNQKIVATCHFRPQETPKYSTFIASSPKPDPHTQISFFWHQTLTGWGVLSLNAWDPGFNLHLSGVFLELILLPQPPDKDFSGGVCWGYAPAN